MILKSKLSVFGVYLLYISILFATVNSAKILFIALTPSVSHQKPFQVIWRELSLRGHDVHVMTPNPLNDPFLKNLTEYDFNSLYELKSGQKEDMFKFIFQKPNFPMVFIIDMVRSYMFTKAQDENIFTHPEMQTFLKQNHTFDLVIAEWYFPLMAAFAAHFDCPLISISSMGVPVLSLDAAGNPSHPIAAPNYHLPVTRAMPLRDRLLSALYSVHVRLFNYFVIGPMQDKIVKKHINPNLPYFGDIERNVSAILMNRNPVFHRVMPFVSNVVELGTIKVNKTKKAMEPKLKQFLDTSTNGVIYFSLGSNMLGTYIEKPALNVLMTVFKGLPCNVLFKWENDTLPGKPDNVFISKWIPQIPVLEHPNVKVFITQGGLQSAEEAIVNQVPIIGFPIYSDQTANIDTFVTTGMGIGLDLDTVTVEQFNASIYEVMTNSSYQKNAERLSKLLYDQPISALDKAIWWIEYVIRHKGAKHLRSPILDIPWWQYLMLDVITIVSTVISLMLFCMYFVTKKVLKYSRNKLIISQKSDKKDK